MITERTIKKLSTLTSSQLNEKLLKVCNRGNVSLVDFLLFSPHLKEHATMTLDDGIYIELACGEGHVDLLEYFLHNPQFVQYLDVKQMSHGYFNALNYGFLKACTNGKLNVVQYLIEEPLMISLLDVSYVFNFACLSGKLHVVQFLLEYPITSQLIDISANNYETYRNACEYEQYEVVNYLISKGAPFEFAYTHGTKDLKNKLFNSDQNVEYLT